LTNALPELQTSVGEYQILGNPTTLMVPEKFRQTIAESGDSKPMFITVAVPIGKSRILSADANKDRASRMWPEHVMDTLVDRINESALPGYRGHAAKDEDLNKLPNAAVLWISAAKGQKVTGEKAVLARGYVYDVDNNRHFLRTGAFNSVSPMAMSLQRPEVVDNEPVMMVEQANWLSLDFVRKNTEGIRGATVVSMEGAAVNMLTPEQKKLIAELGLTDLQQLNPALVSEIAKSASTSNNSGGNDALVEKLTSRVQELTRENANYLVENTQLTQVAAVLGCKPEEVASHIGEIKAGSQALSRLAAENAISKLGESALRDVVAKRLKDVQFGSPQEAEEAVAREVATAKEYVAALGGNLGGINTSGGSTGGGSRSGVLNQRGQQLVGRN
jgi:hypothetical protein